MADLINVTPEKLKATASSFQQAGKDVKKTTSDMLQLVRGISSSIWSGEASSIYLGKFNGLDADIAKMCKMIEEESQHLTTIAQEYQLAEEQNKQVAATLKNNVIAQIVQTDEQIMLSVMIFCHDKREGDLIGKICNQCVALIDKEFLRNFIISDEEYHQVNIEGIQPPDLLVVEITGIEDLCRAKRIRGIFPRGRLLVVSTNQISAESYLIPEVSPDMLLLKPYVYAKACRIIYRNLTWCCKDKCRKKKQEDILKIRTGGEIYCFHYEEIQYLEARDKKIILHVNKYEISFYSSLQKLEKSLPDYFIRCHRSYIVNFMFIQKADLINGEFYLNKKTVIPISQKYKAKLAKML